MKDLRFEESHYDLFRLEAIFGRSPSDEELANELDLNMEEFYHFQRDANASVLLSVPTGRMPL